MTLLLLAGCVPHLINIIVNGLEMSVQTVQTVQTVRLESQLTTNASDTATWCGNACLAHLHMESHQ